MTTKTDESVELDVLVRTAIQKVEEGSISLDELLTAITPADSKPVPAPSRPPLPLKLTDEQQAALKKVTEVYCKVVPTERRELEPAEVAALVEEKSVLDQIKKMAEARHKDIRAIIFNHMDVEAERTGLADESTPREEKTGHYILEGEVYGTPDAPGGFKRTISNYAPSVSEAALKALADDPTVEDFTHDDYLAMTEQTRVLNENKMMLHLKKRPELISLLTKAITPGSKRISIRQVK